MVSIINNSYYMTNKRLLLAGFALLMATVTQAIPAKPGVKRTVTLADGNTVELTLRGDEHFSYYTDAQDTPFLMKNGQLKKMTQQEVTRLWTARKQARMEKVSVSGSRRHAPMRKIGNAGTTTGKHRGLVILIQFPDCPFVTPNTQQTFNRFFNEIGYHDNGMAGSVKDFFLKQSYDQLEIDFDVVGPYTTQLNMDYYGAPTGDSNDSHPAKMVREAVDAASKDVDFSNYDWDDDGEVDQVFVIFAGYNQAQGGASNTIWPHEWILAGEGAAVRYNNKTINTYGCSSELKGNGGNEMDGIGTACHEFSHCLGLPDMYDTNGQKNFGMSYWDVMDAGSYNDDSRTPAGYTAYERWYSGWMEPTEIKEMTRVNDMKPLQEKAEAYILYNEKNRNEYYILENRQPVAFDKGLYGHGLLILHVDYNEGAWMSNNVNVDATCQRMTVIPADGRLAATLASLAGDPWPGTKGNTSLTNYTSPAATLYNENADGTKFMNKPIDNIKEDVENMTVSFVACRPELLAPDANGGSIAAVENAEVGSFTLSWPAVSGAVSYEVELTEIGKAATTPEEALQREFTFEKFYAAKVGFSDLGDKLPSYGLSGWTGSKIFATPNKMRIGTSTANGFVQTPYWSVPESQDITVVLGTGLVKADTPVTGTLQLSYGASGVAATTEDYKFEVNKDGMLILHFTVRSELFRMRITPDAQLYLNYMAIYDGEWSAEQLGYAESLASARRYAQKTTMYTASTNSITFSDMNTGSRYVYRVRSLGEENTVSQWSAEQTFTFSSTGIANIWQETISGSDVFDLQGRKVVAPRQKGIYIRNGKKVAY